MDSVKVMLDYQLLTNCPECKVLIDLVDQDDDCTIADAVFNNAWDKVQGYEVCCPDCGCDFKIKDIEY
jgi:hypothetical protein